MAETERPSREDQAIEKFARLHARPDLSTRPSEAKHAFPVVWFSRAQLPKAQPWIIKGFIAPGDIIADYGPTGSGKTFLAADLAFHIAAGIPWRGLPVRRSFVVYIACEAGTAIIKRFIALREKRLGDAHEGTVPLAILTRGPNLLNISEVEVLIEQLRTLSVEAGFPLGVVVIDTLSRAIPGGDENSSEDMTRVIAVADRIRNELHSATMLIHHSGKDNAKGARGHSSLSAAADIVLHIDNGVATVEKIRDGVAGAQFAFRLDPLELGHDKDGDAITTCTVEHLLEPQQAARPRPDRLPGAARTALQALQEALDEHGERLPETSSIPPGVTGIRIEHWRARFALRYGSGGKDGKRDDEAINRAFRRGKERLQGDPQRVGVSDPYCWLLK